MDSRWRCPVCGFVHEGPTEPDFAVCPVCGTPAEERELGETWTEGEAKTISEYLAAQYEEEETTEEGK